MAAIYFTDRCRLISAGEEKPEYQTTEMDRAANVFQNLSNIEQKS